MNSQKAPHAKIALAVFIPGMLSGSPTYELLVKGVQQAVNESENVTITVIEAGFNQAEWKTKLTAVAATAKYDAIISSNPSLPDIAKSVAEKFPSSRFIIFDGELRGNPAIYTLNYDKAAQAYILGALAALLTAEMGGNSIGLVSAQHYPVMDNIISPYFLAGAQSINPGSTLDFRIVGHWSDPDKALEIATNMYADGVKVILTIAGAGNEGVVQAASQQNGKVLWFDTNAYNYRPGIIAGCCATYQDKAAYTKIKEFLNNSLTFSHTETAGFKEGYIDFLDNDPLYYSSVSEATRTRLSIILEQLRKGMLVPEL
jgi:simple sugar transport system substrate-binding protein